MSGAVRSFLQNLSKVKTLGRTSHHMYPTDMEMALCDASNSALYFAGILYIHTVKGALHKKKNSDKKSSYTLSFQT